MELLWSHWIDCNGYKKQTGMLFTMSAPVNSIPLTYFKNYASRQSAVGESSSGLALCATMYCGINSPLTTCCICMCQLVPYDHLTEDSLKFHGPRLWRTLVDSQLLLQQFEMLYSCSFVTLVDLPCLSRTWSCTFSAKTSVDWFPKYDPHFWLATVSLRPVKYST